MDFSLGNLLMGTGGLLAGTGALIAFLRLAELIEKKKGEVEPEGENN